MVLASPREPSQAVGYLGNLSLSPCLIYVINPVLSEASKVGAAGQGGNQKEKCMIAPVLWSRVAGWNIKRKEIIRVFFPRQPWKSGGQTGLDASE